MAQNFKNKINIFQQKKPFTKLIINIFNDNIKKISMNHEYKNLIYYPASTKEWFSSVYSYNKSFIKSLIVSDSILNRLLGAYANRVKNKVRKLKRRRNKKIRYSANKLYLSKAELKHTNTKLVVLVYLFNKQKFTFQRFLVKLSNFIKATEHIKYFFNKEKITLESLVGLDRVERIKSLNERIDNDNYANKKLYSDRELVNINKYKVLIKPKYLWVIKEYNKFSTIYLENKTLTRKRFPYINKSMYLFKQETMLLNVAKNLNFNTFKFSTLSLNLENLGLLRLIKKIYENKVELKVVDLKSVHLNSEIFSATVALKLRNRHNKAVRVLRKAILKMVRMPDLHTLITSDDNKPSMNKSNFLSVINQQVVSGVRFEAAGRLTRRLTAMRAVFKYRYAGSLKNIRSSFNGKSSTILRGVLKSNGHYTLINSKTRNGTFGLKGWVSTH
uniref:Ribosomal protein VAR1 n=1 Tax=Periconia digitata TaxID=1303443 RepID=UPI0023AB22E3|nr:Ribosomal protein VAR1 [Periconia digitata]WCA44855.1 Ribosomal protein VAR1 [Periconia digitata]